MALRSWQSLPEISKIALGKEFFRFLGSPTHRGRLYSSSIISFELEKKKFSIRGMSKKKLNNFFLKNNIDFDFNEIDKVFDAAIYLRPILSLVVPKFYNNAKYAKKAVGLSTKYYKYLSPDLKADKEICKLAMRSKNGCMVKHMPKEIVSNPRFAKQCIAKHVDAIRFIPKEILEKRAIQKVIKSNLDKVNCRSTLNYISDDYASIAIVHNPRLFNMTRFLKNKAKSGEDLLKSLSICNAISTTNESQGTVPFTNPFSDDKNILSSAILKDIDKFFVSKNYSICLKSLIFIFACLDWQDSEHDVKKMYKLTTCAIAENIAININKLKNGDPKERRRLSIQFQDLVNRIKNSFSPFLLVDYPDLKSNKEISKISEYVLSKLNINSNGFTFNFNGFRGEPLTTGVTLYSPLMTNTDNDIPF
tara:strand:- start:182 stop:1438 length:1257 start_codon:yes stop_codon:yes gene_type:complete